MAKQPLSHLFSIFSIALWGDFGPLTIYKNKKGRVVWFAKTWPHKPASPLQAIQRQKMRDAAIAWHALTPAAQAEWERATKRASLCLHGYDLFVHHELTPDTRAIQTLERQTNTNLLP